MFRTTFLIAFILFNGSSLAAQSMSRIENELLDHVDELDKASNYGGTSDYDKLSKVNRALRAALIKYGSRTDVLAYSFPKLKDKIFITTSRDGKFRAYSWDREEGGTMHDFYTIFQYRGSRGQVRTWPTPYSEDISDSGAGGFVHQIFQTETTSQPIYFAVSTFIGSTSLASQTISAFTIMGGKLDSNARVIRTAKGLTNSISFGYDFFSVVDHTERPIKLFFYDETEKSFRFPVVIEDQKMPQGRVTGKFIIYKFDGRYFVKVS